MEPTPSAKQSQQRVKALKLLTKRNRGISLTRMFEEIQRKNAWMASVLLNWKTNRLLFNALTSG